LPEYQQTAALWVRGVLREHYGVDTRGVAWRTGGERVPIALPGGLDVRPLGEDLPAALAAGRLDALIAPRPPAAFEDRSAPVGRLWPDYRAEEIAWRRATGFFPIMHCIAVRRDVAERHPWLPVELFRAFARARAMALAELRLVNVLRVSMPLGRGGLRGAGRDHGRRPWPYGFARNRDEVAAMVRFAVADGLGRRGDPARSAVHPSTLGEAA
jgi:4,5-dihydroxyphthalate decarboxylase